MHVVSEGCPGSDGLDSTHDNAVVAGFDQMQRRGFGLCRLSRPVGLRVDECGRGVEVPVADEFVELLDPYGEVASIGADGLFAPRSGVIDVGGQHVVVDVRGPGCRASAHLLDDRLDRTSTRLNTSPYCESR